MTDRSAHTGSPHGFDIARVGAGVTDLATAAAFYNALGFVGGQPFDLGTAIAEQSETTGIVTHMKALGPDAWGRTRECAAHIEAARGRDVAVWADQYPYEASGTSLFAALVPRAAQQGGRKALAARMVDATARAALLPEIRENIRRRGGAASLMVAFHPPDRGVEGQSLEAIQDGSRAVGCAQVFTGIPHVQHAKPPIRSPTNMSPSPVAS